MIEEQKDVRVSFNCDKEDGVRLSFIKNGEQYGVYISSVDLFEITQSEIGKRASRIVGEVIV